MAFGLLHATIVAMLSTGASPGAVSQSSHLYSTQVATVISQSAPLHADASDLQPVVNCLQQGDRAIVIFVQGEWLKVRGSEAREGWLERTSTSTRFEPLAASDILAGRLDSDGR